MKKWTTNNTGLCSMEKNNGMDTSTKLKATRDFMHVWNCYYTRMSCRSRHTVIYIHVPVDIVLYKIKEFFLYD